jgi:hypothetical protein
VLPWPLNIWFRGEEKPAHTYRRSWLFIPQGPSTERRCRQCRSKCSQVRTHTVLGRQLCAQGCCGAGRGISSTCRHVYCRQRCGPLYLPATSVVIRHICHYGFSRVIDRVEAYIFNICRQPAKHLPNWDTFGLKVQRLAGNPGSKSSKFGTPSSVPP